ncbi:MAG: type II toxin-antitoxin system HicB family antitoxin [Candidatus Aenigmarchaeota archaeon]|nr:type II toxin-antitoxin system HicB family antitoxin [Candidatus Aenigmarchaeota archaeon]
MKFRVVLEPDVEDGGFIVHVPALPGCFSQGDTREDALKNIREAMKAYIQSLKKDCTPIPKDIEPEITLVTVHE